VTDFPSTNFSLLAKLAGSKIQHRLWDQFVEMYQPAITHWLIRRGLQRSDADDCTQQILMSIVSSLDSFEDDHRPASFRRWVQTITRNQLIDAVRRIKRQPTTMDDSQAWSNIEAMIADSDRWGESIELEYRRFLFLTAAKQVRDSVASHTWQAFWMTQVENHPTPLVAKTLGMPVGSVYVAKGRVLQRLQAAIKQLEEAE
jgi:RNA polymerase sigma-70 factor (ECF subfamily)